MPTDDARALRDALEQTQAELKAAQKAAAKATNAAERDTAGLRAELSRVQQESATLRARLAEHAQAQARAEALDARAKAQASWPALPLKSFVGDGPPFKRTREFVAWLAPGRLVTLAYNGKRNETVVWYFDGPEEAHSDGKLLATTFNAGPLMRLQPKLDEAARFASGLAADQLVTINVTARDGDDLIVVWYWA